MKNINLNTECNIYKNSVFNLFEGYFIEYDIEFPNSHHNYYNDFLLAPENLVIDPKWLSEAQREVTKPDKSTRLTTNLFYKPHYLSFLENLIMYINLGAKITTVHKVIKFEQETWLKSYIDFNLNKRLETGQDLFQLANNSVFGKTMENV